LIGRSREKKRRVRISQIKNPTKVQGKIVRRKKNRAGVTHTRNHRNPARNKSQGKEINLTSVVTSVVLATREEERGGIEGNRDLT